MAKQIKYPAQTIVHKDHCITTWPTLRPPYGYLTRISCDEGYLHRSDINSPARSRKAATEWGKSWVADRMKNPNPLFNRQDVIIHAE